MCDSVFWLLQVRRELVTFTKRGTAPRRSLTLARSLNDSSQGGWRSPFPDPQCALLAPRAAWPWWAWRLVRWYASGRNLHFHFQTWFGKCWWCWHRWLLLGFGRCQMAQIGLNGCSYTYRRLSMEGLCTMDLTCHKHSDSQTWDCRVLDKDFLGSSEILHNNSSTFHHLCSH